MSIDKDIAIINESIIHLNPVAVILYGSYGRGEGGWYIDKTKGELLPYNDYDIMIIFKNHKEQTELDSIKKALEKEIKIRWIDICQETIIGLKSLKNTIFNFDLKYGSKVIYGDSEILDLIPNFEAKLIPLEEGNILFQTRMWTFFGSIKKGGFNDGLEGESSRFFRNQMAKAILAVVDVLLLLAGMYHTSYKVRLKNFKNIYNDKKELLNLAKWSLNEKLNPKDARMESNEVVLLYERVHYHFVKEMMNLVSKRYKSNIDSPEKLIFFWKYHPSRLLKRLGYLIFKQNFKYELKIKIDIVQIYLLFAFNPAKIDNAYLSKATIILKSVNKDLSENLNWHDARRVIADMRLT